MDWNRCSNGKARISLFQLVQVTSFIPGSTTNISQVIIGLTGRSYSEMGGGIMPVEPIIAGETYINR